ncbi:hypothetical protein EDD90_2144 [Streptomyces sp. Ag109_O5-1]|nr:hypothetical protein EDD90_2144 [Streptomyces sp. Ag109_O5-1]
MTPYGRFEFGMNSRLDLDLTARAATVPGPRTREDETAAAPAHRGSVGRNILSI